MDTKYFEEIKAREQAATGNEWRHDSGRTSVYWPSRIGKVKICGEAEEEDAAFISHARTDIPTLIAEVERLTDENSCGREANESCHQYMDTLQKRISAKDQQIATLKKALELACDSKFRYMPNPDYFIQQAQEQETEK